MSFFVLAIHAGLIEVAQEVNCAVCKEKKGEILLGGRRFCVDCGCKQIRALLDDNTHPTQLVATD